MSSEAPSPVVAICGGSKPVDGCDRDLAISVGRALAIEGVGIITGACPCYPEWVTEGHLQVDKPNLVRRGYSMFSSEIKHREGLFGASFPLHLGVDVVYTGNGGGRNDTVVRHGNYVVAFPGGLGTGTEKLFAAIYGIRVLVYGHQRAEALRVSMGLLEEDPEKAEKAKRLVHGWETPVQLITLIRSLPPANITIEW